MTATNILTDQKEQQAWSDLIRAAGAHSYSVVAARKLAIVLQAAKATDDMTYHYVRGIARFHMRNRLEQATITQRQWQTKVSRRPQRGNHHDSWSIREKYVTCKG